MPRPNASGKNESTEYSGMTVSVMSKSFDKVDKLSRFPAAS
jgi:hypothetical protein